MAYSYKEYTADGSTSTFAVPFDYIEQVDVKVFIDGVEDTGRTFTSSSTIQTSTTPSNGALVRLERNTDIQNRAVDFAAGSVLTEEDLDNSNIQVFYAAQEAIDTAESALIQTPDGKWDAESRVIKNLADPVNPQDSVTKNYLENTWLTLSDKAQLNALNLTSLNRVYQSIDNIDRVDQSIDNVDRVHTSITNLDRVHTSIANVDRVHTSIDNVDRVEDSIANVDRVATSADNLDRVHTSIGNVDRVDQSIDNVDRVATSADNLDRVHTSIGKLDRVHTSISAVDTVAADLNEPTSEIETVANSITNVNNVGTNIQNVIDVDANESNINAAVANASNINAAVANASNINNAVANATNINAAVANEANITAAVTNQTNINAAVANEANITTVAGIETAVTTVAGIQQDIQDLAAIEQDIQDVQDSIANLQTVASDLNEQTSDVTTVANSITNVDLVGGSIGNVNTVADNINDVNNFADTYSIGGTAPVAPTTGDLWFDTASNTMKVYDGSGFVNAGSSVNGVANSVEYTATAGQTTFSATYDAGYIDVYLNGVKLAASDYTATDGSNVVLDTGATAGDIVFIQSFGTFTLADVYNQTQSDARYMPIDAVTLPDQTGHAGQYLTTDGTNADWADVPPAVTSDIHVFYTDSNGDLIWEHGAEVTDLQDANGNDLYDLVIVGSSDQTYAVNQTTGNLQVTIG